MFKERFLLYMLALIFLFQAGIFSFALYKCSTYSPNEVSKVCPEIGERYDNTFNVAIATVLALLTGNALKE